MGIIKIAGVAYESDVSGMALIRQRRGWAVMRSTSRRYIGECAAHVLLPKVLCYVEGTPRVASTHTVYTQDA